MNGVSPTEIDVQLDRLSPVPLYFQLAQAMEHAIVGGKNGANAASAHTVMITSRGGDICSATAIARDLVITAAHCVSKADIYSVSAAGRSPSRSTRA